MKIRRSAMACAILMAAAGTALCFEAVVGAPRVLTPVEAPFIEPIESNEPVALNFQRQVVFYATPAAAGTIIIDTAETYLYYVLGDGKAIRYGIGVGREGFTWSGPQTVTRMAEWPDWTPPQEMIERQPYLSRWMAGGIGNPLGARAIYLGSTVYRIHGTNAPETIGTRVSSGCFRLTNDDVADLYSRVKVGTKIMVLPNRDQKLRSAARAPATQADSHNVLALAESVD